MLKNLGERIRKLRKDKKITLVELSSATGVAQATLSRIETGTMTGTIESHEKIAEAIGVGLAELYQEVDARLAGITLLPGQAEKKVTVQNKNLRCELLAQQSSKKKITPLLLTLQPNAETDPEKNERGVEKFLFVLSGEITITVESEKFPLKPEDSLYFDASLAHTITNTTHSPARLLVTVSPSKI